MSLLVKLPNGISCVSNLVPRAGQSLGRIYLLTDLLAKYK